MMLIEHSEFGAQVVETECATVDELVDLAIEMQCWGLTYYFPCADSAQQQSAPEAKP